MNRKCQIFVNLKMAVKLKEYFEETIQVKIMTNIKKNILRGQRNARYHEKNFSNKKKSYNFFNFL